MRRKQILESAFDIQKENWGVTVRFSEIIKLESKGLDIHRQVKINDKTEQRFGVVMTPLFLLLRT